MRHPVTRLLSVAPIAAFGLAVSLRAAAQPAAGTMKHDAATSGSTAVATEGFDAAKKVEGPKDTVEAKVQAGGILATGNSDTFTATSLGTFRIRRGMNDFSASVAANYADAPTGIANGPRRRPTVENYQGKLRYDRFLTESVAAFLSFSGRRDRFQGLDLRLNLDPGLAYYVIDEPKEQLWAELGYDFQYDVRRDQNIQEELRKSGGAVVIDKTETRHSLRAFAGYRHQLNDNVGFNTGVEFLLGIPKTDYWRLNWDAGLTAAIAESFSLATTFSFKYDNHPLPGVKKTDTLTAVNLVYTLF
jgi:putative salt-induced outer membrane protein